MPGFGALDALSRPWRYHESVQEGVDWWIAACAFYGGILFMIGGFSGSSQYLTHDVKTGLPNAYVGLVFVTFCVGSYLFTLGCFLMTVPVINEGYLERSLMWKLQSSHDSMPQPKYRWLGFKPSSIAYWGGVVYTCGAVLYNIGTTVSLADQFESVYLSPEMEVILEDVTFLVGGVGFLLGGASFVVDAKGSKFLQGILIPWHAREWRDLDYWVNWLNFWGGVGFFGSGVFLMFPSLSLKAYRIENAIGFGLGSTCFTLGGFLLFIKLSLAKKQMEDEEYDHVRGDSFGSIALSTMSER